MKKIFSILAAAALVSVAACGNEAAEAPEGEVVAEPTTAVTAEPAPVVTEPAPVVVDPATAPATTDSALVAPTEAPATEGTAAPAPQH